MNECSTATASDALLEKKRALGERLAHAYETRAPQSVIRRIEADLSKVRRKIKSAESTIAAPMPSK